jgi:hypothetical protein
MSNNLSLEEQLKQGLIEPGQPLPIRQTIELQFQGDELSKLQEKSKQILLTESKGEKNQPRKLLVTVEGIHTGMTKNLTFYPGTTLESSVPTWTTPHKKPVIKNHNIHTEPLGRIAEAEYVESTLTDKYTVRLKLEITDEDAITKILDGRYLTLSVGGSAKKVVCSICAKDLVQEGWCGHARGRKYEEKQAHWTIADYTGDEISFVNQPADVHSQVIAAELVTAEGGKNMAKTGESTDPKNPQGIQTNESETDIIDNLLGDDNDNPETQTENQDPKDPETQTENQNTDNPEGGDGDGETLEEKVARLETELEESNQKLQDAQDENVALVAERDQLKTDLSEMTTQKESAEDEAKTFKEQNVKLARYTRRSMAERVADLRIMQHKDKVEDRESLVEQWVGSSSKVLESTINDLLESGKRHIASVPSPGLAVDDKNSTLVDDEGNEVHTKESAKETSKKQLRTMKDLTEGMTSYMARQNY